MGKRFQFIILKAPRVKFLMLKYILAGAIKRGYDGKAKSKNLRNYGNRKVYMRSMSRVA